MLPLACFFMPNRWRFAWVGLFFLACLSHGLAAEIKPVVDPLPDDCMPSSQVRTGMVGEGRTVFEGFTVGRFKATILGVQHNPMADGNMILAKLEGRFLEKHGVVAGMSGSPVFVDGKCIGAVAYGWSFAYAPYCGITPIENMWAVWQAIGQPGKTQHDQDASTEAKRAQPWAWKAAWQAYQLKLNGQGEASPASLGFRPELPELQSMQGEMRPLWAPLFISGASPRTEKRLRDFMAGEGIEVVSGGALAGSADPTDPASFADRPGEPAPEIEHGSALGVPMLAGDMSIAGVGTVTYRHGDRLIAFGHPMFGEGAVAAPMAHAYIFGFMQSYGRSFKLGEVRGQIGTIDQDRLFAIGGRLGQGPPRTPITIKVDGPAIFRPRTYHFSAWRNKNLLPMLSTVALEESFLASAGESGKLTAHTRYRIGLAGGESIEKSFVTSGEGFVVGDPGMSMLFDLFMLLDNPFRTADVTSLDIEMNVEPGMRSDELVAATLEHSTLRPGDVARVRGRFRPYQGQEYARNFEVALPADLRPGPYVLHVADSTAAVRLAQMNTPGSFEPRDFSGVLGLIASSHRPSNGIECLLFEPAIDVAVRGQELRGLPGSMQALISGTTSADMQDQPIGRLISQRHFELPGAYSGSAALLINVVDHFNE